MERQEFRSSCWLVKTSSLGVSVCQFQQKTSGDTYGSVRSREGLAELGKPPYEWV